MWFFRKLNIKLFIEKILDFNNTALYEVFLDFYTKNLEKSQTIVFDCLVPKLFSTISMIFYLNNLLGNNL